MVTSITSSEGVLVSACTVVEFDPLLGETIVAGMGMLVGLTLGVLVVIK